MNEENIVVQDPEVSSGDAVTEPDISEEVGEEGTVKEGSQEIIMTVDYDSMYMAVNDAVTDALAADLESTDGQSVSSSALTYFEGILANQVFPEDYVIYVGEPYTYDYGTSYRTAYEYCMVTGDLDLNGNVFSGSGKLYRLRLNGNVGVTVTEETVSVTAPAYYSRSNLGDYSGVIQRDFSGYVVAILLMIGGLVWFVRKLLRVQY